MQNLMKSNSAIRKLRRLWLCGGLLICAPLVVAQSLADSHSESPADAEFKLARGGRVTISNTSGRITVTGWERDTIEATATQEDDARAVRVAITGDAQRARVEIERNSQREWGGGREIHLTVRLPRYAELESVQLRDGEIEVRNMEGAASITGSNVELLAEQIGTLRVSLRNGSAIIRNIKGNLSAHTMNGEMEISDVAGTINVTTFNGDLHIKNANGDVTANSTSGEVSVECAKGRVEVHCVSGSVEISGVGGNVEADSTSGEVTFKGRIREDGRYRLKSLSGEVTMYVQADAPGFTAQLASYSGEIETDFQLRLDGAVQGPINRRVTGRYGNGQAQIVLDSFSGAARILKAPAAMLNQCK